MKKFALIILLIALCVGCSNSKHGPKYVRGDVVSIGESSSVGIVFSSYLSVNGKTYYYYIMLQDKNIEMEESALTYLRKFDFNADPKELKAAEKPAPC